MNIKKITVENMLTPNCVHYNRDEKISLPEIFNALHIHTVNTENVSDGYHTFGSLYNQRKYLFAALVKAYKDKAWKSKRHSDGGEPFDGGWFIVGISTPEGQYTYHYKLEDWELFECKEIVAAPPWDGHTDKDVTRLMSL